MKKSQVKLVKKYLPIKERRDADLITAYMNDPDNPDVQISATLKKRLDTYILIEGLKMKFKQDSYIASHLVYFFKQKGVKGYNERKAYYDIKETERIFGKVKRVDYDFTQYTLMEGAKEMVRIALANGDSDKIANALLTAKKILGTKPDDSDMPDMSKIEPHKYVIQLPPGLPELLLQLLEGGNINLSNILPAKLLNGLNNDAQDAEVVD
jgi:hypothetical protein